MPSIVRVSTIIKYVHIEQLFLVAVDLCIDNQYPLLLITASINTVVDTCSKMTP